MKSIPADPHLYALVADGIFYPSGSFRVLPPIPETALREVLRHHVLDFLCDEAGFDHQLAEHMRQWDPKPEQPCPRPALAD